MKLQKIAPAALALGIIFMIILAPLSLAGKGTTKLNGFGVDSQGKLYVGRLNKIEVHENGKLTQSYPAPPSRAWSMSVSDDHIIVASAEGEVYTYNLTGNLLSIGEEDQGDLFDKFLDQRQIDNGSQYEMKWVWGWTHITKDDTPIYWIPFIDFILKVALYGLMCCFLICIIGRKYIK